MIVVASHDSTEFLTLMLSRLSEINLNGHDVCIVDTNSTHVPYLKTVEWLRNICPNIKFDRKEYTCWDTGAYVHGYRNYTAEKYIFLQDSLFLVNPNFVVEIDAMLDEYDVVPLFNFGYGYDNEAQRLWAEDGMEVTSLPEDGFFGPIFAARKSALDRIPSEWFREPTNKVEGCGMERRWSLMFHLTGATKKYYEYVPHNRWMDFWNGHPDYRQNVAKFWVHRK